MSTRKKIPFNNSRKEKPEKANPKEKTEEPSAPSQPSIPELTFTEEEVQKVANFVNFLYKNAKFDKVSAKDATVISNYFDYMHAHISKLESYILEFMRITNAKKED